MATAKKATKRTKKEEPFVLDPPIVYVLTSRRWFVAKVEGVYPSRAKAEVDQAYYSRVVANKVWSITPVPFVSDSFDILIKGN
jgi:hypothetical protein